jgi:peptide/nickel transport system substrate-binding protein
MSSKEKNSGSEKISRRRFLKYTGAGIAAVAVGAGAYYAMQPGPTPTTTTPTTSIATTTAPLKIEKYGGTAVVALYGEPTTLNPAITNQGPTQYFSSALIETLFVREPNGDYNPSLATSWKVSDDKLTYTFKLQENVTWHDGKPFTADDVKFNIEQVLKPYNPFSGLPLRSFLQSVEVQDKYNLTLKLKNPYLPLIYLLADKYFGSIVPKHLYEGTDILTNPYNAKPVGTGPYIFQEWVRGSHLSAVRNPNYWRKGKPYLDKLIMPFIVDEGARLRGFETGEIDFLPCLSVAHANHERLMKRPDVEYTLDEYAPYGACSQIFFNLRNPNLKDVKVRQAMAHALNIDDILSKAFYGNAKAAVTHIPPSQVTWHNPNAPRYPYDPDKADKMLDEAGYKRGPDGNRFTLVMIANVGQAHHTKQGEIAAQGWKKIGVNVDFRPLENTAYNALINAWNFDLQSHSFTVADPTLGVQRLFDSRNIQHAFGTNVMGYVNPDADALWDAAAIEGDLQKRKDLLWRLQVILNTDLPSIPIADMQDLAIWKNEFSFKDALKGYMNRYYENAWWKKGRDSP